MENHSNCCRLLLARHHSCQVVYCEQCGVVEVSIGALSVRLDGEAFVCLAATLAEARAVLHRLKHRQDEVPERRAGAVH